MKYVVAALKKRAFLSDNTIIYGDDFEGLENGKMWVAAGHVRCAARLDTVYGGTDNEKIWQMTHRHDSDVHKRLQNNLRLTVGILSLLFDRRESAEHRRKEYGPFSDKEFRQTENGFSYQTPTNWWVFAPMLAHLMLGATRMAYFITLNDIEEEIWEGFEEGDVTNAIHNNSYDVGEEIWALSNGRLSECGYKEADNPFWQQRSRLIEFLLKYGVGTIGEGIYKNWRMARKMGNYQGHFNDLPAWESGAFQKVFTKEHPKYQLLEPFLKDKSGTT
jgi:hypothetical protein